MFHSGIKRTPYEAMLGCAPRVGLSTTPIPREVFESVEDEQQFENALTAITASSEPDDAVHAEETSNQTVKVCVVCSQIYRDNLLCWKCEQPIHVSCSEAWYSEDKILQKVCRLCLNERNI